MRVQQRDRWMFDKKVAEPRLTAEYTDLADVPEPMLRTITATLSDHYGVPYDGLWLNLYHDHHDSTGWHGGWRHCVPNTSTRPRPRPTGSARVCAAAPTGWPRRSRPGRPNWCAGPGS
ncbi:hypothetical protein ACQEVF_37850 [Nonomuraea polychroma]|uniref:hypothetical protein n=1 Tax=Nonomuraea polychroma TaxID=46176 RepID=UPI003D9045B4